MNVIIYLRTSIRSEPLKTSFNNGMLGLMCHTKKYTKAREHR
jgi:hypothetical protein